MNYPKIYIEEIRSTGGAGGGRCPACGGKATRSMCEYHLRKMKFRWRKWSADRVAAGRCVKCNRPGQRLDKNGPRGVHCACHREINRKTCLNWSRENGKKKWWANKRAGVCVNSKNHGLAKAPHVYCAGCLQRRHIWKQKQKELTNG